MLESNWVRVCELEERSLKVSHCWRDRAETWRHVSRVHVPDSHPAEHNSTSEPAVELQLSLSQHNKSIENKKDNVQHQHYTPNHQPKYQCTVINIFGADTNNRVSHSFTEQSRNSCLHFPRT